MDVDAVLGNAAPHLSVTRDGGVATVATVALTRPDKHNAVSYAMWLEQRRVRRGGRRLLLATRPPDFPGARR